MSSSHFIPSPSKMNREVVLWSVVQFPHGETAVVLESWFKAEEQTLSWPPKHITLKKALRDGMQPDDKWITYKDVRVLTTCETLDEAKKRETKYNTTMCPTSEMKSHDEGALRQKRISRPNQQFMHSDPEDHQSSSAKRKRFAKPPGVGCPGPTSNLSQSYTVLKSAQPPTLQRLGLERAVNESSDGMFYSNVEELQTPDESNTEMPGFATACAQYHQLQNPQRQSTSSGLSGCSSRRYNHLPGLSQCAQNRPPLDFSPTNSHQNDVLDSAPNQGCKDATTQRASDNGQLLKDLAIHNMTSMLAEVLVMVKDLSRDVQFIKNNLAQSNITPGGTRGPANLVLPFQLPIASEEDFSKAESLLIEETVRQKMIARLALVGGTDSANMIRRMLTTCMTNALASHFNWAGKNHRCSQSKKPFKDTILQECLLAAARQFEPRLTDQNYSETVKKWFRYAPDREGGIERQPKGRQED
ncbi:uncharacterized protein LOC103466981 isoform X2 [Poecilia reticulata]|uniref:uncharacterized protein LOC103466981 isoform X2 n=1 Tax=Poecilia reticulata TaxID=8081 RepID=UPI0004A4D886|nr:PREDICTED: uncharacterized protein LOC103466981 isoform X2 [Poecilia reticulata]